MNPVLVTPLTREDVEGVYAGLRPLLSGESESTSKLSREHTVAHPAPGLVVVAGGKYTTYRVMAKDAVDAVSHGLDGKVPECCTDRVPLVGRRGVRRAVERRGTGWPPGTACTSPGSSTCCTGTARWSHEVLALVDADPSLGDPVEGADDYLRAEIVYAASHEGARHLDDVLTRRTRISIETFDRGVRAAPAAAALLAPVLGWSEVQTEREIDHYLARVEAERLSQEQPDDQTADTARLGAPEIVPLS